MVTSPSQQQRQECAGLGAAERARLGAACHARAAEQRARRTEQALAGVEPDPLAHAAEERAAQGAEQVPQRVVRLLRRRRRRLRRLERAERRGERGDLILIRPEQILELLIVERGELLLRVLLLLRSAGDRRLREVEPLAGLKLR